MTRTGTKTRPRKIYLRTRSRSRKLRYRPTEVRALFHTLDASGCFEAPAGELSIIFLDDPQIARLHGQFMEDPSATDVITFEGDSEMDFAGEICVSIDRAYDFASRKGLDFSRELALYLVHGYLHLAGFDDLKPELKRKMRTAEKKAMSILEEAGKLPAFSVRSS